MYINAKRIIVTIMADDSDGPCDDFDLLTVTVAVRMPAGFLVEDRQTGMDDTWSGWLQLEAQRDRRAPAPGGGV